MSSHPSTELTAAERKQILDQIGALAETIGARALVLTPLGEAQALTSQIWRLTQKLRARLLAAQQIELEQTAERMSHDALSVLATIEALLTPGEKLEMEEIEALTSEDG